MEKWITGARPALPGRGLSAVHMRTELSTVQLVSSVIPATAWPLTFCFSGVADAQLATDSSRVAGCSRLPLAVDGCRRCRHGCPHRRRLTGRRPPSTSSRPRPTGIGSSPASTPSVPPTSRPDSTRCCLRPSRRSPACSADRTTLATTQPDAATAEDHRQDLPECPHQTPPTHVQTAWPLTTAWVLPGLPPRMKAAQPSAPRAIILALRRYPAARPYRSQSAGCASVR